MAFLMVYTSASLSRRFVPISVTIATSFPPLTCKLMSLSWGSWLVDSHYYLENDSYSFSHNTQTSTQAPRTLSTSCVGTSLAQSRCFQYFFQSTTPKHKTTIQNMKLRLMRPCHSRLQLKTEKQ